VSSQFPIDQIEPALIQLLARNVGTRYGAAVDIESLGDQDFNEDGNLILNPPAIRVRYSDGNFGNLRDNRRLTYQATFDYEILCFESSLQSEADQRLQTLKLVSIVLDELAGARITLADNSRSMPITIKRVSPVIAESGPVDQLFSILIGVEGIAQFSGVNG
jgi:phage gp37-like protein